MLVPPSPTTATHATSWDSKPTSKARGAQSRVYGKRRVDAPRAVFEQGSPIKSLERATEKLVQDAVDCIQAKLAEVTLNEFPVDSENDQEPAQSLHEEIEVEHTPTPKLEPLEPEIARTPSPVQNTLKLEKRYERMVEVRITPRKLQTVPTSEKKHESVTHSKSRKPRQKKSAQRLSSGCVPDEKVNAYVRTVLDEAVSPIAAQGVQKFSSWAARAGNALEVVKLAEGSYGEVYKLRLREEVCMKEMSKSKLARLRAYGDGVFKVVPLRAQSGPGSKKFTSIEEIVSEVKMLKYLDPIPGFARFREIHVVQGRFPDSFQAAWDHYKKTKDDCMNPNPSSKRAYPDTQLWAIVEMDNAGCELEKFSWSSIFQIYDIFWGVAMALARAEEYALFEWLTELKHRDLHLGNVCIKTTRSDGCMAPPSDIEIMRQSWTSGFGLSTLETTIIDYSLSRAELRASDDSNEIVDIASSDLDKKQIFDAIGRDEDEILLRDTYRHMRAEVYTGNPVATEKTPDIPGIWAEYAPRTNLIWLLFILKNLLKNHKSEPSHPAATRSPLAPCSPNKTIETKQAKKSGEKAKKPLLGQIHVTEADKRVSDLKKSLEDRLKSVLDLLDLERGHKDMCCAADLVAYAIDSQWLSEEDFF
ncbi:putative serine/threonine-protein kinase haspin homolog [Aspergillus udagawae]|uniref:non-specific serine/threonine protein kinase n=1 Tax=Aspergillus udagawae TaxID=91492 RepID=A0A8H3NPJ9_9EURO|nr:putative serine/threonine-protein kinase haspin homolog [Aspergillus udagawae]